MRSHRCPRCLKTAARPVRWHGLWERLAAALFYGPFRCQLCNKRFLAFCPGRPADARLTDGREYERFPVGFPTAFSGELGWGRGTVVDLSVNGCSVKGRAHLQPGGLLLLEFHVSQYSPPVEIKRGFVRWTTDSKFGVEFRDVEHEQAMRLRELIEDCWSLHRTGASSPSV